jgi:hypothetical protein
MPIVDVVTERCEHVFAECPHQSMCPKCGSVQVFSGVQIVNGHSGEKVGDVNYISRIISNDEYLRNVVYMDKLTKSKWRKLYLDFEPMLLAILLSGISMFFLFFLIELFDRRG